MAFGLHKPGQGYWVRVLSAAMAGVLIFAAAAWFWKQLALVPIPLRTWTVVVSPATGKVTPGQRVRFLGDTDPQTPGLEALGTGEVLSSEPRSGGGALLRVGRLAMEGGRTPGSASRVEPAPGSDATIAGPVIDKRGEPAIQPLYIQAAGALALMIVGAAAVYWIVGVRQGTAEFLIATDGEMKKVNWSTRKGVIDSTWVVILWSVLLAAGLFIVDAGFSLVFELIGVLERK